MANGTPGDHPLTDILQHRLDVYGKEIDDLIRKIAGLSSRRELDEWWEKEIGWSCERSTLLEKARRRRMELAERAKQAGWEIAE